MASYPPTFLESLLKTTTFLDAAARNEAIDKAELCMSMELRLSFLVAKLVAAPTGESFSIFNRGDSSMSD